MKNICLLDQSKTVVNIAVFKDDATDELIKNIVEANGAIDYFDSTSYPDAVIGSFWSEENQTYVTPKQPEQSEYLN